MECEVVEQGEGTEYRWGQVQYSSRSPVNPTAKVKTAGGGRGGRRGCEDGRGARR